MRPAGALTRIRAMAVKEFVHIRRDRRTLATVLVLPVIQLLIFAYAISFDVRHLPTVVVDMDHSTASQRYVQAFAASDLFDVVDRENSLAPVDELFHADRVQVAIVIPAGYGRALAAGEQAQVAILIDGSQPNSAKVAQAYAGTLSQLQSRQIAFAWADAQGLDTSQLGAVEARLRTWYNPERRSSIFLIPGLMVVVIMIVTVQQTAVTLVREREQGTQEQLGVSPLRRWELMIGKLLPWIGLALVDVVAITAIGMTVFGVPLRGDVAALALGASLFISSCLALGLIISAVAPSVEVANMTGLVISFLPAFLLSGFAFPLDQIPHLLQWVSYAFPARHMVTLSRAVFLKGAGFPDVRPQLLWLTAYSLAALSLAVVLQRRRAR